jgi:uncharacterized protein
VTDLSPLLLTTVGLTFFLAGMVKGVTGMGLPTVAMGLLGTVMPPVAAASLLIVPSFVTNVWQLFDGPRFAGLALRFWRMMAGIVAGTIAGCGLLTADSSGWNVIALGAALAIYAATGLLSRQLQIPPKLERSSSLAVGVATGLVTGGTGVFVIPAVPFIQALGLSRDVLIQALGLSFTVSTIALAIGLSVRGAFHPGSAGVSALAVAPALLGMWAGQRIRYRISPEAFRRWFLIFLLLLGLELMLRPFL